jgi:hypothetical protein
MSLNRERCGSIVGTCGECMSGFVGLLGSSNTLCTSIELINSSEDPRFRSLRSKKSDPHPTVSSTVICGSDADCAEIGLFLECELQSNLCQPIQQSCPNSCSGHGHCVFVSKYDATVSVSECGVLDLDCVARCECETGYGSSSSCLLRDDEVLREMEVRHLIMDGVIEMISRDNADASNVQSWMKTLSLVGSDDLNFSVESKTRIAMLVIDILIISREVGLSIEDLSESGLLKIMDLCVSGITISSQFADLSSNGDDLSSLVSLLRVYSQFVSSDMLEAQNAVTSVTHFLRTSSIYFSSWSPLFSNSTPPSLTLSIPETDLESLIKKSNPFSSQQSIEIISDLVLPFQISIAETLAQLSTIERQNNFTNSSETFIESALSLPLFVSLGSSPCSKESSDCLVRVTLQNKVQSRSLPDRSSLASLPSPNTNLTSFEVDCVVGLVENHSFECPSGEIVTITCNGSTSLLRGRRSCPIRSKSVSCSSIVETSTSPQNISCRISSYNEWTTVCVCNLSEISLSAAVPSNQRSVSFSILSVEKSVLTEFVSTWETVPSLSSGDLTDSWVVMVTLGCLGGSFMLLMMLSIYYDASQKRSLSSAAVIPLSVSDQQSRVSYWWSVGVSPSPNDPSPDLSVQSNPDLKLLEESLPSIFQSNSLWIKFIEEMRVYHRWLGIVFFYSPEFPRSMRLLSLFSSIVIMLFVQSVTYNIADPDDGSCEACKDESKCLSLISTLNMRESRCYWVTNSSSTFMPESCHFREIGGDMTRMFIVAIISAIVSAPFALSI